MSVERDLLTGLQTLLAPVASGPGSLFQLSGDPDVQWALGFTRGPTDPLQRWGQGVLILITRGDRGNPLAAHDHAAPVVKTLTAVTLHPFGSVTVNSVEHRGSTAGPDANRRTVRADTFFLDLDYQA